MDGPVLVFGGPYGNLEATTALLAEARRLAIPASRIICTGDLVAYCGSPVETVDLVAASGMHVVMGNCDEQLAASAGDCGCGFPEGSACERLSAAWYAYADSCLGRQARAWLGTLPRRLDIEIGGRRLAVVHATLGTMNKFVFASSPAAGKAAELAACGVDGIVDGIIAGHSGLPFTQLVGGHLWHNAGVIGMPAHDGTSRVWYSVITADEDAVVIEHRALAYDHESAARAMLRAGLPPDYRLALASGLWPSCDVLPSREIRARGLALDPGSCRWDGSQAPKRSARGKIETVELWPAPRRANPLDPGKFRDPHVTAKGEARATVALTALETLWLNTGTLCNITCRNCYIESSPRNDRLSYLTLDDVRPFLDEIERDGLGTTEIGFTGGEPFMNPQLPAMLSECLIRGFKVLVLTNAMRPMYRHKAQLLALKQAYSAALQIRVSLDHYTAGRHEEERGPRTFEATLDGLAWLDRNGFSVAVAGRTMWGEDAASERAGYGRLLAERGIAIDVEDPARLVLFPEMDAGEDVPEITTACWGILHKSPQDVMCASSRMVVKRKGAERAAVVACTLLPYDEAFELGATLADARRAVPLNHPHCARFCVLGGASCSPGARETAAVSPPAVREAAE
jgi:uncharacterized radical SAM superfamily Fe-S cluster-containing enzyme